MTSPVSRSIRVSILLLFLFLPVSSLAADNWVEVRSPHFTVVTNAGEKDGRKIVTQFEQIRGMFHAAFSTFNVDPPQAIVILAAKNEATMKTLLPQYYETKGHVHPSGLYLGGLEKNYVIMRLDSGEENPFHTLYHEYTHAIMDLNFSQLPLWLNEGLAEFYGNTTFGDKEIKTGTIDAAHLQLLNQSKLIPIDVLLQVGYDSPYYNEADRASVFYAEAWAVVHYLSMDPEARQKQYLLKFLNGWQETGDQARAAIQAFGDLKQFAKNIEHYERQQSFQIGVIKTPPDVLEANYAVRDVSPAEVLTLRADFFSHERRFAEAKPVLDSALQLDPNLPLVHEALSFYDYENSDFDAADQEAQEAIRLGSKSFIPLYLRGALLLQRATGAGAPKIAEAQAILERVITMNPGFAPAFDKLAFAYSRFPDKQILAINSSIRAVRLAPGVLPYSFNLAQLLMLAGRDADAMKVAKSILKAANRPGEKQNAAQLIDEIQKHTEWEATNRNAAAQAASADTHPPAAVQVVPGAEDPDPVHLHRRVSGEEHTLTMEGKISDADCSQAPEIFINLEIRSGPITFRIPALEGVNLSWSDALPEPTLANCATWKEHSAKVWFNFTPGKDHAEDVTKIYFF